ncbi:MAG: GNAT family N-acetyltransferase [Kordiimonas sp.]
MPQHHPTTSDILAIRQFSRFYTKHLGLLHRRLMNSNYSLVEARVLYELAQTDEITASDIRAELELDQGYLSRILKRFEENGLISKKTSSKDARITHLSLTEKGKDEAHMMAEKSGRDIAEKLKDASPEETTQLVHAMHKIEATLGNNVGQDRTAIIRSHRPGDIGWVIEAHGKLYSREYGFNEYFEALVARIAADFISDYDPKLEHCWIAEVGGENVGSIFLVKEDDKTAKLRLLLVDPKARGLGLGKRLVSECISFAKRAGYKQIVLWTNDGLTKARRIYEATGFTLQSEETHSDFGPPQVGQHWQLDL